MSTMSATNFHEHRESLIELLREYEDAISVEEDPRRVFRYSREIARIREELDALTRLIEAEEAAESLESIQAEVSTIRAELSSPDLTSSLETKLEELTDLFERTIEQSKARFSPSTIEPRLSVLQPSVKLVDASLAYKYADLQADINILFGLTTLFLGTGISTAVSLGIAISTSAQTNVIAIHSAVLIMSLLVTIVFGGLTYRSFRKANEARAKLEADAEVSEAGPAITDRLEEGSAGDPTLRGATNVIGERRPANSAKAQEGGQIIG